MNDAVHDVVDRCASRQDCAGGQHRALAHDGAFVDAAVAADKHIVFDDDGVGVPRFEHAPADVGADIDIHRRNADHATSQIRTLPNRGAADDDADALFGSEAAGG